MNSLRSEIFLLTHPCITVLESGSGGRGGSHTVVLDVVVVVG